MEYGRWWWLAAAYFQSVVREIQEAYEEDGVAELGQGLCFGFWILKTLKVDEGNGGKVRHCDGDGDGDVGDEVVRGSEGKWTDVIVGAE